MVILSAFALLAGCTVKLPSAEIEKLHHLAGIGDPRSYSTVIQPALTPYEGRFDGPIYAVSLRTAERELRRAFASQPAGQRLLSFGGLTEILGYDWDGYDLRILGRIGTGPVLLLDQFAAALRIAHDDVFWLTLLPDGESRRERVQKVRISHPEIKDVLFVAPLTLGDYRAKHEAYSYVARRYEIEVTDCPAATAMPAQSVDARIFFIPAVPEIHFSDRGEGFVGWIEKSDVRVMAARDVEVLGGKKAAVPLPAEHPLAQFSSALDKRFVALEIDGLYKQVHNMFRMFLLAQLLRRETIPYDFSFWLSEYRLERYALPEELPSFQPKVFSRNCWGRPYAATEYSGTRVIREIAGGIIMGYKHYFPEWFGKSNEPSDFKVAAGLGESSNAPEIPLPSRTLPSPSEVGSSTSSGRESSSANMPALTSLPVIGEVSLPTSLVDSAFWNGFLQTPSLGVSSAGAMPAAGGAGQGSAANPQIFGHSGISGGALGVPSGSSVPPASLAVPKAPCIQDASGRLRC
jgi:hypothetical protein